MDTNTEFFNQSHSASDVIKGQVADGLPTKAEEVDLRFLRVINLSDSWDGESDPDSGTDYVAILYGNQIAWQRDKFYLNGERQMREEKGNKLYYKLYGASQLYLKIVTVAYHLFHRVELGKGADVFFVDKGDLDLLREHPQYAEMVRDFGLELRPTKKAHYFQVVVTKRFERLAS